ncbi:DUF927 domain-containing protein [Paraburkholderia sp. XV]|uniref:DUF927 domain-containing protein n=1 Tax=Paraburkholderia sp. XV TaxID=2831520 RepID=UPI001CD3CFCB|nr:DUF927 domain-containing protein [Paraburkholderia sp. XV]
MKINKPPLTWPNGIRIPDRVARALARDSLPASAGVQSSSASAKQNAAGPARDDAATENTRRTQDPSIRSVALAKSSSRAPHRAAQGAAGHLHDGSIASPVGQARPGLKIRWCGRVADPDGGNPAHLLEIETPHKTWKRVEISEKLLSRPTELSDLLIEHGARFRTSDATKHLADNLRTRPDNPLFVRAAHDGWTTVFGSECYVFGDQMYSERREAERVVRPAAYTRSISGTLDDWLTITSWCAGNPLAIAMLCFGFSAALVQPLGHDSFGVVVVGRSSMGKSTILRLVRALTDTPLILPTWEGTPNGHEAFAAQHSGKPHVLDELGQADVTAFDQLIYRLANGGGKLRATSTGAAGEISRISTVFLSAGEQSPTELLSRGKREVKPGQLARFVALPVDCEFGAFANLHDAADGAQFARRLDVALRKTHGVAWSPYVKYFAENLGYLEAKYAEFAPKIRESVIRQCEFDTSDGLVSRVLDHFAFACFAGLTAIDAGVLRLERPDVYGAIRECFTKWFAACKEQRGTSSEEILEEVRALILDHRNRMPPYSAFSDAGRDTQFGFTYVDNGVIVFLIFPHALQRIVRKHGKKTLDGALKAADWLILGSGGRPTKQYKVPGQGNAKVAMYAIRETSIFGM